MTTKEFKAPKNYAPHIEKAFGVAIGDPNNILVDYKLLENNTIQIEDRFTATYSVTEELLNQERNIYKYTIQYKINGIIENEAVDAEEEIHGQSLPPFTIVRKLFYIIMSYYQPAKKLSSHRLSAEQRKQREIGRIMVKFLNKGMSYVEAEQKAEQEFNEKSPSVPVETPTVQQPVVEMAQPKPAVKGLENLQEAPPQQPELAAAASPVVEQATAALSNMGFSDPNQEF